MLGLKLWYSTPKGCTRCGKRGCLVASPYWGAALAGEAWCNGCLAKTGRR